MVKWLQFLFGGGRNVIAETAGVFRENAEARAERGAEFSKAALGQFAAEFKHERRGLFDRFIDGLNRLPRPFMVISLFALFASAMFDPVWFSERMQGLSLVPEPLWWVFGTVVTFYFGGRFQVKAHEFQRSIARTTAQVPQVIENIQRLRALRHDSPGVADAGTDAELEEEATDTHDNPAIDDWKKEAR